MNDLDFGFRVRFRRRLLGISQDDLGRSVGISQVAIKKIEAGGNTRHGRKIAATLKTTLQWLETGVDQAVDGDGNRLQDGPQDHATDRHESRATYNPTPPWPLKKCTLERINALTPAQQRHVDETLDLLLKGYEAETAAKKKIP